MSGAYGALMSARDSYTSVGNSVASMQENATDVAGQNEESQTFYKSLTNQLETAGLQEAIPSIPGVIGAAYALKKAYSSLGTLKDTVLSGVEKGKALLAGKGEEAAALLGKGKDLVTGTLNEVKTTVTETGQQLASTVAQTAQNVTQEGTRLLASGTDALATYGDEASAAASRALGGVSALPRQLGANLPTTETGFDEMAIRPVAPLINTAEDVINAPLAAARGNVRSTVAGLEQEMTAFRPGGSLPTVPSLETVVPNVEDVLQPLVTTGPKIAATVGAAVDEGSTLVSAGAKLATDTAVGLADIALPVVGEIGLVGLGVWQAVKGFEDLFNHPTVPTAAPVPVVANISQSMQSGI
jgi:hypothetical protein